MKLPVWVVSCLGIMTLTACGGGGGGSNGPNTSIPVMQPLQSVSGTVPEGTWRHSRIQVPAGYARLKVVAGVSGSGSTRMVMLHEQQGSDQHLDSPQVECDVVVDGTNITCEVSDPASGTWYISHKGLDGTPLITNTAYYDNPVSLPAYGGQAYAFINQGNAGFVNNGETDGDYWSGTAADQWLAVELDQDYQITEVVVHSNVGASFPRPFSVLDASAAEAAENSFFYLMRHNAITSEHCASLVISSGRTWCRIRQGRRAAADISINLEDGATTLPADVRIYEIEVHGF